ncbi:MAG: VanZ family protein [Propionivibrio sp.]
MKTRETNESEFDQAPASATRPSALPRHLALAYSALIIYASLHPFSGWRDPGLPVLVFLDSSWPRYWTGFDLVINIAVYVPLGFLVTLSLRRLPWRWLQVLVALSLGAALSLGLECLQTWLPSRVASNLDFACNALGNAFGVLLAYVQGDQLFVRVTQLQHRLLAPTPQTELGLVLIGVWLLTQLSPETILFGAGDLRNLLEIPPTVAYAPSSFFAIETGIIVCNTLAVGLVARTLFVRMSPPYLELCVLFVSALAIRTLAAAILVGPGEALAWLTPGAGLGLMIGGGTLSVFLLLPGWLRQVMAGLTLMAGTVLVNLAPPNPYSEVAFSIWQQGHFLNFNGLTRLSASLWPFLALSYLTTLGRRI